MEHQKKHDIPSLESRIKNLSTQLKHLANDEDFEELVITIHQPGFTTPAEYLLLSSVVDAMHEYTKVMLNFKQVLVDGSRAIELNPQPLPPKSV